MTCRKVSMAERKVSSIGAALRQVRQERGLTLREVERRGNIPHGYLGYVEMGKRPPKLDLIWQVAEALDLSPEWTQVLAALAVQERLKDDVADYTRTLADLPRLKHPLGLSPGAVEAFIDGWREADAMTLLSTLASGGGWKLQLLDPQGRLR